MNFLKNLLTTVLENKEQMGRLKETVEKTIRNAASSRNSGGSGEPSLQTGGEDALQRLERLAKLKESGVLSESEFNEQKAVLLQRMKS